MGHPESVFSPRQEKGHFVARPAQKLLLRKWPSSSERNWNGHGEAMSLNAGGKAIAAAK